MLSILKFFSSLVSSEFWVAGGIENSVSTFFCSGEETKLWTQFSQDIIPHYTKVKILNTWLRFEFTRYSPDRKWTPDSLNYVSSNKGSYMVGFMTQNKMRVSHVALTGAGALFFQRRLAVYLPARRKLLVLGVPRGVSISCVVLN